ncbi:MAG: hypothetical protein GY724_01615 [Actinomycetia bacterium]|nr:hypothetical protein [Actinomycetes bacterium]MCP4222540.1 hypothetical protein [Actinomycetes bacterium]MCP5034381.1 hypothetical protein [Actinomycetes bacterium]
MTNSEDHPADDPASTDIADNVTDRHPDDTTQTVAKGELEAMGGQDRSPLPFQDLRAPTAANPTPPVGARFLAFTSILIGGLLGALIGYGTTDLMAESSVIAALGAVVGAALGAVGVGVVAALALRAMNEWEVAQHPEDERTIAEHQSEGHPIESES